MEKHDKRIRRLLEYETMNTEGSKHKNALWTVYCFLGGVDDWDMALSSCIDLMFKANNIEKPKQRNLGDDCEEHF
jgi:hypothetical protein